MKLLLLAVSALFFSSQGTNEVLNCVHCNHKQVKHKNLSLNPEIDALYWYKKATAEIAKKIKNLTTQKSAKNIILFLGDGMSVPTLTAARIFLAQRNNQILSESPGLSFEDFPFSGFSKTYCVDNFVADSACSATAYLGGAKGNSGTIGVSGRVTKGDAKESANPANHVFSFAYLAQKSGKATGIVTNTRVTHASPAGTYAHIADRAWECDADLEYSGVNSTMYEDIAEQLIYNEPGRNFNVILGGGKRKFIPKNEVQPSNETGSRIDRVDLIKKWEAIRKANKQNFRFVSNRRDMLNISNALPDYLFGLFAHNHMDTKSELNPDQPSLEEMTKTALEVLQKTGKDKGYFLFVEGGAIDMAHHDNKAHIALDETIEFSKAVAKAVEMTSANDTLIVVTADHAHTMTLNGYPSRKESIFGFAGKERNKLVYTTLSYANGPGYTPRKNLSRDYTGAPDYVFPAAVPLQKETHGGDDVAVFARGPNAQMFSGTFEQSYIPHAMAYTAGIRPNYP